MLKMIKDNCTRKLLDENETIINHLNRYPTIPLNSFQSTSLSLSLLLSSRERTRSTSEIPFDKPSVTETAWDVGIRGSRQRGEGRPNAWQIVSIPMHRYLTPMPNAILDHGRLIRLD